MTTSFREEFYKKHAKKTLPEQINILKRICDQVILLHQEEALKTPNPQNQYLDARTGALNQTGLEWWKQVAFRIFSNAKNSHHPRNFLVGIKFDLTDFKKEINDKLGHEVGDKHLQKMTELLKILGGRAVEDAVYRDGGDEFFVFCLTKTEEWAKSLVKKWESILAEHHRANPVRTSEIPCVTTRCIYTINPLDTISEMKDWDMLMADVKARLDKGFVWIKAWEDRQKWILARIRMLVRAHSDHPEIKVTKNPIVAVDIDGSCALIKP